MADHDFQKHLDSANATIDRLGKRFEQWAEEHAARMAEVDRRAAENERRFAKLNEEIAASRRETDHQIRKVNEEITASRRETDRQIRSVNEEIVASRRETDRQIRSVSEQIGALNHSIGYFAEGMALPSMERILKRRFGAQTFAPRFSRDKNGQSIELDLLAYSNGRGNRAFIVEIKNHLRQESLDQLIEQLRAFPEFCPEHRDKELFGILAGVSIDRDLPRKDAAAGIYLATIHDETFSLKVPRGFKAKSYQHPKRSPHK